MSLRLNCAILSAQNKPGDGESRMLKKILFGGESGLSPFANAGLTLLRIFAGASLCLAHGLGKLPPSEGLIEGTAKIGFPLPIVFAWAAALAEFLGGAFLALGLFTRVSSFFIAFTMLVARCLVSTGRTRFRSRNWRFCISLSRWHSCSRVRGIGVLTAS